jgi:hypothetical protein
MGKGEIPVSAHLLDDLLHLPDDVYIMGAEWDADALSVRLLVEGNSVPDGMLDPRVTRTPERFDWEWGAPNGADPREVQAQ